MNRNDGRQYVIVFEGPDGCGKTNIAQELSTKTGIPYFKFDGEPAYWREGKFKDALRFDQPYLGQFLSQTEHSVIVDRAWPSEWVYSRAYGRETDPVVWYQVDKAFAQLDAIVVVCMRRSYVDITDDLVSKADDLQRIHDLYTRFMDETNCHVILMFVDDYGDHAVRRNVVEQIDDLERAIDGITSIGSMTAHVLLGKKYGDE